MRIIRRLSLAGLAAAGCVATACTAPATHQAQTPPAPVPSVRGPARGPVGSIGNPLLLTCTQSAGAMQPARDDVVVGPLDVIEGKTLPTANPSGRGYHGNYKIPIAVASGATVTITIAPQAEGHVVIDNPYGPAAGVTAATYHPCTGGWTWWAQGFAFTDGRARGCVPLDVYVAGRPPARVTISLFAGPCPRPGLAPPVTS